MTDFGELRVGMIVVGKPCFCGGTHRGILLPSSKGGFCDGSQFGFELLPGPDAHPRMHVSEVDVRRGKIYRVEDELGHLDSLEASQPKPQKLARVP